MLTTLLNKHCNSSLADLDKIAKNKNTSALELIVISAIKFSIQKADSKSREFLIERMVGKVPTSDNVNVTVNLAERVAKARARVNKAKK